MKFFLVGGGIGMLVLVFSLLQRPLPNASHPIQGFAVAFSLGALVFGLPLWLLFG